MSFLDPVFGPLLQLPLFWAILILSFAVSLLITIIYKFTTNQSLMKQLKDELKEFQKEMKELKHDPSKMMAVQKKAMQTNMKYMMHSMRSTLITFLPIIFIFGWMQANLAYQPILPGEEFTAALNFQQNTAGNVTIEIPEGITLDGSTVKEVDTSTVKWVLKGKEGEYLLNFDYKGMKYDKDIIITSKQAYKPVLKKINDDNLKSIQIENQPIKILNLFGWKVGWLGSYIIFSLIFSMVLRKIMKIY